MAKEDIKKEIMLFVQALETNYTDTIRDIKVKRDLLNKKAKQALGEKVN